MARNRNGRKSSIAGRLHLFPFQPVPFFLDEQHRVKLVGGDLVEADSNPELHRRTKIECPANQLTWF